MSRIIASLVALYCLVASVRGENTEPSPTSQNDRHGFSTAFEAFVAAARSSDRSTMAKYASTELVDNLGSPFEQCIDKNWRIGEVVVLAAPKYLLDRERIVIVEAIIERHREPTPSYHVMYWIKRENRWTFLNFPFYDASLFLGGYHPFANDSFRSLEDGPYMKKKLATQPASNSERP